MTSTTSAATAVVVGPGGGGGATSSSTGNNNPSTMITEIHGPIQITPSSSLLSTAGYSSSTTSSTIMTNPSAGNLIGGGTINSSSGLISGFTTILPNLNNSSNSNNNTSNVNSSSTTSVRILPAAQPSIITSMAQLTALQHTIPSGAPSVSIGRSIAPLQHNITLSPISINQNYVVSTSTPPQVYIPPRHLLMDESNPVTIHHHTISSSSSASNTTTGSTSQAMSGGSGSGGCGGGGDSSQPERLKVEDALNYLDQVKYKFSTQPQVYNDFLDIMKEFKSQSIDTPGVISRVSDLFSGHPDLIVGFNTFLPPGFKVEVQMVGGQNQGYTVKTVQTDPHGGVVGENSGNNISNAGPPLIIHGRSVQPILARPPPAGASSSIDGSRAFGDISSSRVSSSPPLLPRSALNMSTAPSSNNFADCIPSQSQPAEFSHAVNYVNKIKHRFHGQPEKYKQFLDILQMYQKEKKMPSKQLTEQQVFSQMSVLFENQEDLLQEFGQFLNPEGTPTQNMAIKTAIDQAKENVKLNGDVQQGQQQQQLQPKTPKTDSAPKRRSTPSKQAQGQPQKKRKKTASSSTIEPVIPVPPVITLNEMQKMCGKNDVSLFEKIRNAVKGNAHEDFLRCLKIYNDEVVNRVELLTIIQPFLIKYGNLWKTFKKFINGKMEDENELLTAPEIPALNVSTTSVRKIPERPVVMEIETKEIETSACTKLGSSYIALPQSSVRPVCSGQTDLDKLILNSTWMTVPSPDNPSILKPKYNEIDEYDLQCEDERHEMDLILEMNIATIKALEKLLKKVSRMSTEEACTYKLDENLGGNSGLKYQNAIHRIYGNEMAPKIMGVLMNSPAYSLPIVIRRLKDKDSEWRKSHKTYKAFWRQQMEKVQPKGIEQKKDKEKGGGETKSAKQKPGKIDLEKISKLESEALKKSEPETPTSPTAPTTPICSEPQPQPPPEELTTTTNAIANPSIEHESENQEENSIEEKEKDKDIVQKD